MLLGSRFTLRPNGRALGAIGSDFTSGLSINGFLHSKNQFDERKQDGLVQKFRLRLLQRLVQPSP